MTAITATLNFFLNAIKALKLRDKIVPDRLGKTVVHKFSVKAGGNMYTASVHNDVKLSHLLAILPAVLKAAEQSSNVVEIPADWVVRTQSGRGLKIAGTYIYLSAPTTGADVDEDAIDQAVAAIKAAMAKAQQ